MGNVAGAFAIWMSGSAGVMQISIGAFSSEKLSTEYWPLVWKQIGGAQKHCFICVHKFTCGPQVNSVAATTTAWLSP